MNKWISLVLCGAFLAFQTASAADASVPSSDASVPSSDASVPSSDSSDSAGDMLGKTDMNVTLYCFNSPKTGAPQAIAVSASIPLCYSGLHLTQRRACGGGVTQKAVTEACSTATNPGGPWYGNLTKETESLCSNAVSDYDQALLEDSYMCISNP